MPNFWPTFHITLTIACMAVGVGISIYTLGSVL